jgi:hypothetical protein
MVSFTTNRGNAGVATFVDIVEESWARSPTSTHAEPDMAEEVEPGVWRISAACVVDMGTFPVSA